MSWVALGLASVAWGGECEVSPEDTMAVVEKALVEERYEDAGIASDALIEALGCGEAARPELIARLWLSEAVLLDGVGERQAATDALAAAARLAPSVWVEGYGQPMRQRWQASRGAPLGDPGTLRIEDLPPGYRVAVDGLWTRFPASIAAGPHLVQLGRNRKQVQQAQVIEMLPSLDLVVRATVSEGDRTRARRRRRVGHALLLGGFAGLMYGTSLGTSAVYNQQPANERSATLATVNNGLIVGSAAMGAVSVGLLVRGLASR